MSHLFDRLASSVTRSAGEPSLRPLAGSIYMPANQPGSSASQLETIDSPAASQFSPTVGALPGADLPATARGAHPLEDGSVRALRLSASQPPAVPAASQFSTGQEPQSPERGQESMPDGAPPMLQNTTAVSDKLRAADSQNTGRSSLASRPPAHSSQISIARHQPLLSPTKPEPPNTPLGSLRGPEQSPSAAQRRSADSGRSAPAPSREPDEIFIHIGRVEVAAVQQSPQQPAARPAPQRKSINLSDYLRRGSGRSR